MNEELFKSVIETVEEKLGCVRNKSSIMQSIITATATIQSSQAIIEALHQVAESIYSVQVAIQDK
jgi:hypothetical protein